jgi:purine-nucleoside phosphorylase
MAEGLICIDMGTSAVAAAAQLVCVAAIALLSVWDALPEGKTFLDPMSDADAQALSRSSDAVFTVALRPAEKVLAQPTT